MNHEKVLILDTSWEPLYFVSWEDAISNIFIGKLDVIEEHPTDVIRTTTGTIPAPLKARFTSDVFLRKLGQKVRWLRFNKKNLYLRDNGKCQYCDKKITFNESTMDHIVPKSQGGMSGWRNIVLSCNSCNQKKGAKSLEASGLFLKRKPVPVRFSAGFDS